MDHEHALRTYAVERYASRQMNGVEMDEFEEHFFTCLECARAVEDCQALLANGRELLRRQERTAGDAKIAVMPVRKPAQRSSWVQWGAVAASLLFGAGMSYQYLDAKHQLAEARAPRYVQSVALRGVTRSQAVPKAIQPGSRTLILSFFPDRQYSAVEYELRTPAGTQVVSGTLGKPVSAPSGECQIALVLDSSVERGEYDAKVMGVNGQDRTVIGERRISVQ